MIMILCFLTLARQIPINYILLSVFTITEAYMVSAICTAYDPTTVVMATVMTAAMTFALTLYACTTKTDITMYGGVIFVVSCGLLLLCIFGWFFQNKIFQVVICVVCICLYGIYLIYDTQLVVGSRRYQLSVDDYIVGAIIIYVDIIVMFLRILELLRLVKN